MKKLLFLIISIPIFVAAQTDSLLKKYESLNQNIYESLENYIENQDDEVDISEEIPEYLLTSEDKIDINNLPPEIGFSVLKLTDYQYYQLQLYIDNYGELVSLYELYAIEGFSRNDVDRIIPHLILSPVKKERRSAKEFMKLTKHRFVLRYDQVLEKQAGYLENTNNKYLGTPMRLLFRYQANHPFFSIGISGEKDAGEEFFKGRQKRGFDFYAFHICIKEIGIVKKIVLGDYRLNYGQGLVLGSGFGTGKGSGAAQIRKFSTGISAVTPLNESQFFRGGAIELGNATYKGALFYGYKFHDGSLDSIDNKEIFTNSLTVNGYHRTEKEILKRHSLFSRNYGFNFQLNKRLFRIGITAFKTDYSKPVSHSQALYKKYDFKGMSSYNLGIDHQIILAKSILFGEIAMSKGFNLAILEGLITEVDPRCKLAILLRYYDKKYIAFESAAFGRTKPNKNELGLYLASDIILGRKTELTAYCDIYHNPWLKYQIDFPSFGYEVGLKTTSSISKNSKIIFRYQFKKNEKNYGSDYYNIIRTNHKHQFRAAITSIIFNIITLKTEVDYILTTNTINSSIGNGLLLIQDIDLEISKIGIKIKGRFALFDTDSYEERIYAYEKDLLFTFSSNAYFGKGCRGYLIFQYDYQFFKLQIRFSQTFYANRKTIGSGLNEIVGSRKSDLKALLYFTF
jgi:hypothetical protein